MRKPLAALFTAIALLGSGETSSAHHYFAMFDSAHPIRLVGTVKELRYTGPHSFIFLEVKDGNGAAQLWNLEGSAPSDLARDGWSSTTLKPGDELELTIDPLRSGAPGGAWNVGKIKFRDGRAVIMTHRPNSPEREPIGEETYP
jgi:Family of unknown function (DUF6152)